MMNKTYDFAIVGAGVFGAWTAHFLRQSGASVALLDAHGPANSRASSGGETRVIRMGYGPDELYTRWAMRSLPLWREFAARTGKELFHPTGVLWLSNGTDNYLKSLYDVLGHAGVKREKLGSKEIQERWPQFQFKDVTWGVLEPESGVLMARSSVQALVADLINRGVEYRTAIVLPPDTRGKLAQIKTSAGESIAAGTFIFACGPWLPKIFPELLRERIFVTRQEVFFIKTPINGEFSGSKIPVFLHHTHPERPYEVPDINGHGLKVAFDVHGGVFDPDSDIRVVPDSTVKRLYIYLKEHIPLLQNSPVIRTQVCQYENTWNGDFLIDSHPEVENAWIVGGGSGHGFKHGPALGEYLVERIQRTVRGEHRFSLQTKKTIQNRVIY